MPGVPVGPRAFPRPSNALGAAAGGAPSLRLEDLFEASGDPVPATNGWVRVVWKSGCTHRAAHALVRVNVDKQPLAMLTATQWPAECVSDASKPGTFILTLRMPRGVAQRLAGPKDTHGMPSDAIAYTRKLTAVEARQWLSECKGVAVPSMDAWHAKEHVFHPHLMTVLHGCTQTQHFENTWTHAHPIGDFDVTTCTAHVVVVPPRPVVVEEGFARIGHPSTFAQPHHRAAGASSGEQSDSSEEPDVPLTHVIQRPELWDAHSKAAASKEMAQALNGDAARYLEGMAMTGRRTMSEMVVLFVAAAARTQDAAFAVQKRYCAWANACAQAQAPQVHPKSVAKAPAAKAPAAKAPAAKASTAKPTSKANGKSDASTAPPQPLRPRGLALSPSDSEDEAFSVAAPVVAASSNASKRSLDADGAGGSASRGAAQQTKAKKKKTAIGASGDEEVESNASSDDEVGDETSEEADSDDDEEEDDDEDYEDEDEDEDKASTNTPALVDCFPPRPVFSKCSEGVTYQLPSHAADAQRFWNIIETHGSSFSAACAITVASDCKPLINETPAPELFKAAAYNRLLGHALGCLEDVLEERRPDQCALVPRAEALAARQAAARAVDLCDRTLPQLDDAIAKLEALRTQARAALVGIADDLPAALQGVVNAR